MADAKNNKAVQIGRAYGALTRRLTEQANAERVRIAQANFDATRTQIGQRRNEQVAELSGVFQKHIGSVVANAAFRGVGGGSVSALVGASTAEAEVARRNIDINANNMVGAAAAEATVPIEDPVLSELEGTFRGLGIGGDFVEALARLPSEKTESVDWIQTGLGYQAVKTTRETPASFDLQSQFPELTAFLDGGN